MRIYFFHFFLIFTYVFSYSQTWEHEIYKDNVYKLRDKWGDSQRYIAKFTISNDSTTYFHQAKGEKDKWIQVAFPDDFTIIRGIEQNKYPQIFIVKAEILREVIFTDTIIYYPGPKGYFQLIPVEIPNQLINNFINEKLIDAYKWEDALGVNYFIRTNNCAEKSTHIYFYHFIENKTFVLKRKHVDYINNCKENSFTEHVIESIQITDLNEDNIAEISCTYNVGCNTKQKKILMLTEGKKYFLREDKDNQEAYKIGSELIKEAEFLRFLQNKWEDDITKE